MDMKMDRCRFGFGFGFGFEQWGSGDAITEPPVQPCLAARCSFTVGVRYTADCPLNILAVQQLRVRIPGQ